MGASHLSRAVYSPFNNIITIKSLVRRRAGVQTLSFEDGADSAKRSPRSASVCTQYEHFCTSVAKRAKCEVAKNRENRILECRLGVPGASNTLL